MYHVEGQPYNGMLVFRITLVTEGGKMNIVHQNFILSFGGNIDRDSGDGENWQDVNDPQDSISADSGNRE